MVFLVTLFIVYWVMYDDIMETGTVFMSLGLIMSLKKNLMSFSTQLTAVGKVRAVSLSVSISLSHPQVFFNSLATISSRNAI